jgi:hypothetical protein
MTILKTLALINLLWLGFPQFVQGEMYFSVEFKEKIDVFDYYPLTVGNKWLYRNEYRSITRSINKTIRITWLSEISIKEQVDIPEGKMIVREIKTDDAKFEIPEGVDESELSRYKSSYPDATLTHYLIQGNYVLEVPSWGWNKTKKELTGKYKQRIKKQSAIPVFFFPMSKVRAWSDKKTEEADYRVFPASLP